MWSKGDTSGTEQGRQWEPLCTGSLHFLHLWQGWSDFSSCLPETKVTKSEVLAKVCWYLSFNSCGGTQSELAILEKFGFGEKCWSQHLGSFASLHAYLLLRGCSITMLITTAGSNDGADSVGKDVGCTRMWIQISWHGFTGACILSAVNGWI